MKLEDMMARLGMEAAQRVEIRNAIVRSADLVADGILRAEVDLDMGGSGVVFGAYMLGKESGNVSRDHTYGWGFCAEMVARVMKASGVHRWGDVAGRPLRVALDSNLIIAIGHFIDDDWFCPRVEWASF